MAMTDQTVTNCVSNYSGQWFNNCLALTNVKGHITSGLHIYTFSAYMKQKVSKAEITQLHEYSELHVRNNFTTQKGSKDSDSSLVSNENFNEILWPRA